MKRKITMMRCAFGSGTVLTLYDNLAHCVLGIDQSDGVDARYPMTTEIMRELAQKLIEHADALDANFSDDAS